MPRGARNERRSSAVLGAMLAATNRLAHAALGCLSTETCSSVGALFGTALGSRIAGFWPPDETAKRNWLALHPSARDTDAEQAMRHARLDLGRTIAEYAVLHRLRSEGRIKVAGSCHLELARQSGLPVIVMGLHLSNWEVIGPALIELGHPFSAIYRVPRSPALHRMAVSIRERYGGRLLPQGPEGARAALEVLKMNKDVLLIYADDVVNMRVQAPRLRREFDPCGNLNKIIHLAMLTKASVIPAYVVRCGGPNFQVNFGEAITPQGTPGDQEMRRWNYEMLDRLIETIIRNHLSSWYLLPLLDLQATA